MMESTEVPGSVPKGEQASNDSSTKASISPQKSTADTGATASQKFGTVPKKYDKIGPDKAKQGGKFSYERYKSFSRDPRNRPNNTERDYDNWRKPKASPLSKDHTGIPTSGTKSNLGSSPGNVGTSPQVGHHRDRKGARPQIRKQPQNDLVKTPVVARFLDLDNTSGISYKKILQRDSTAETKLTSHISNPVAASNMELDEQWPVLGASQPPSLSKDSREIKPSEAATKHLDLKVEGNVWSMRSNVLFKESQKDISEDKTIVQTARDSLNINEKSKSSTDDTGINVLRSKLDLTKSSGEDRIKTETTTDIGGESLLIPGADKSTDLAKTVSATVNEASELKLPSGVTEGSDETSVWHVIGEKKKQAKAKKLLLEAKAKEQAAKEPFKYRNKKDQNYDRNYSMGEGKTAVFDKKRLDKNDAVASMANTENRGKISFGDFSKILKIVSENTATSPQHTPMKEEATADEVTESAQNQGHLNYQSSGGTSKVTTETHQTNKKSPLNEEAKQKKLEARKKQKQEKVRKREMKIKKLVQKLKSDTKVNMITQNILELTRSETSISTSKQSTATKEPSEFKMTMLSAEQYPSLTSHVRETRPETRPARGSGKRQHIEWEPEDVVEEWSDSDNEEKMDTSLPPTPQKPQGDEGASSSTTGAVASYSGALLAKKKQVSPTKLAHKERRRAPETSDLSVTPVKKVTTKDLIEIDLMAAAQTSKKGQKEKGKTWKRDYEKHVIESGRYANLDVKRPTKIPRTTEESPPKVKEIVLKRGIQREGAKRKKVSRLRNCMIRAKRLQAEALKYILAEALKAQKSAALVGKNTIMVAAPEDRDSVSENSATPTTDSSKVADMDQSSSAAVQESSEKVINEENDTGNCISQDAATAQENITKVNLKETPTLNTLTDSERNSLKLVMNLLTETSAVTQKTDSASKASKTEGAVIEQTTPHKMAEGAVIEQTMDTPHKMAEGAVIEQSIDTTPHKVAEGAVIEQTIDTAPHKVAECDVETPTGSAPITPSYPISLASIPLPPTKISPPPAITSIPLPPSTLGETRPPLPPTAFTSIPLPPTPPQTPAVPPTITHTTFSLPPMTSHTAPSTTHITSSTHPATAQIPAAPAAPPTIPIPPELERSIQDLREELKVRENPFHKKQFREYCDHVITPELNEVASLLIKKLVTLQDRAYKRDPIKAKMRRRYVCGLKEAKKLMRKLSCVIVAPNIQQCKGPGALDEVVENLLDTARSFGVPLVYALNKKKIGYLCIKKVPVSCFAIMNYQGAQDEFNKLLQLVPEARKQYNALVQSGIITLPTDEDDEDAVPPVPGQTDHNQVS